MSKISSVRELAEEYVPMMANDFFGENDAQYSQLCEKMKRAAGMELVLLKYLYYCHVHEVTCWEIRRSGKEALNVHQDLEEERYLHRIRLQTLVHM
jgi:hypothetical protein